MARGELRIASPDYQGKAATNQEYLIESILLPAAYFVPGEWARKMPTHYLDQVTDQELADLLVWIAAQE